MDLNKSKNDKSSTLPRRKQNWRFMQVAWKPNWRFMQAAGKPNWRFMQAAGKYPFTISLQLKFQYYTLFAILFIIIIIIIIISIIIIIKNKKGKATCL